MLAIFSLRKAKRKTSRNRNKCNLKSPRIAVSSLARTLEISASLQLSRLFSFSKMGNLFAKKTPKSRVTEQDKAVLQLKTQRDKLKQYQKKIQINLEKERELAKTLLKDGKKDRALLLLKKKRAQETLLAKTVSAKFLCKGALDMLGDC